MNKKDNDNIVLEEYENDFLYKKNKSNLNIQFNRIAFIFFIIFTISLIYTIQLLHLGSLKSNSKIHIPSLNKTNYRADIVDNNGETPLFNDGSCVHPRSITGIEIENNSLCLIKWHIKTKQDGTLQIKRTVLEGPELILKYQRNKTK